MIQSKAEAANLGLVSAWKPYILSKGPSRSGTVASGSFFVQGPSIQRGKGGSRRGDRGEQGMGVVAVLLRHLVDHVSGCPTWEVAVLYGKVCRCVNKLKWCEPRAESPQPLCSQA